MKTVSSFEYAIMQAAHESNPTGITADDLLKVRPMTSVEALEVRKANIESQIRKIKIKK